MTLNGTLCPATHSNCFSECENEGRGVGNEVHLRLVWVGINSGNVVHSNVVHTMEIYEPDHVFGQVLLAWISGALV